MNPRKQLEIPGNCQTDWDTQKLEEPINKKHTTVVLQMPSYGGEILEGGNIGFVEYESWKTTFNLRRISTNMKP